MISLIKADKASGKFTFVIAMLQFVPDSFKDIRARSLIVEFGTTATGVLSAVAVSSGDIVRVPESVRRLVEIAIDGVSGAVAVNLDVAVLLLVFVSTAVVVIVAQIDVDGVGLFVRRKVLLGVGGGVTDTVLVGTHDMLLLR